jgi:hypothetical protein
MSNFEKYNGWEGGYPTWNVALWLDNDGSDSMLEEWATELLKESYSGDMDEAVNDATYQLSIRLKDYIQENNPLGDEASMFSDMLGYMIDSVNFYEIAEHYVEDVRGDFEEEMQAEQDEQEEIPDGQD